MQPDIRVRSVYDDPAPQDGVRVLVNRAAEPAGEPGEGGDAACWAHLVCPECGAMISGGHRPGCTLGPAAPSVR